MFSCAIVQHTFDDEIDLLDDEACIDGHFGFDIVAEVVKHIELDQ